MLEILNEVSDIVKENYFDPSLKGIDWKAALEIARERIRHADHEGEMATAISGLLARLADSHTYFLPPGRLQPVIFGFAAKAFEEDVRVYKVMPGGPAEAAGLKLGDKIVGIEEFAVNRKLIHDEMLYFTYLDPRLTLKLLIVRNGGPTKELVINGKQPATSSKEFVKLYDEYDKQEEKEDLGVVTPYDKGGIAYIRFPTFMVSAAVTDSLLRKTTEARALILDLRDDGGGREDTMRDMASHFFSEPTLMETGISRGKKEEVIAKPRGPNLTAPLFVLLDSRSASASEILAKVLQLKGRAKIVGDQSAGKVNRARMFGGRGGAVYTIPFAVAVTVSQAVLPDGQLLEDRGVIPDVKSVPTEEDLRLGRDPCLEKALALAREAATSAAVNP
jgi:carboxyl-terminal processing protease